MLARAIMMAQSSPYGHNLAVNGDFASDVSEWGHVYDAAMSLVWEAGRAKTSSPSATSSYITQDIPATVGRTYLVEWDFESNVSTAGVNVFIGSPAFNTVTKMGNKASASIVASGSRLAIRNSSVVAGSVQYYDNISVREVL